MIALEEYKKFFKGYTELRVQENLSNNIRILKGDINNNSKSSSKGISSRVNIGGCWGFASNSMVNSNSITEVINLAEKNSEFLGKYNEKEFTPFKENIACINKEFRTKKTKLTQKQLIDFVREIDNYIANKYKKLSSRTVNLNCISQERDFINSEGSRIKSFIPRSNIVISLVAEDNLGMPITLYTLLGGLGEFEDKFNKPQDLFKEVDSLYERLMKKREGVYALAGLKECILDTKITGLFAHEAIGHTTEADLVLAGSIAGRNLNNIIASEKITLKDCAHTLFDKPCPIPVYIDDEGTKGEDVTLIENGVLKSYMHNKETANLFGDDPKGNARAYEFFDEPIIRMRNTCIMPGNDKIEHMISSIEDGYYLTSASNGQADTTSEFMFGITEGYEIKKGKLGRAIKDLTISGVAFDVLKTASMVSEEFKWSSGGFCGKKQMNLVGMGGPSIKCKVNIGGR
ncbi:TldD/PmbA family protein [Clostridium frigidicarnis]|uniref:TldD protein n=1 Tax=Clostridium frigidicarnis TaxID=84698 RepID=A0A1I1BCJ8_9CLOT|nr:TldD/PmbA family protein [Clostridium frigidicarnis]SFB46468.1 TldD protein [Clostridium frigidicarnis]